MYDRMVIDRTMLGVGFTLALFTSSCRIVASRRIEHLGFRPFLGNVFAPEFKPLRGAQSSIILQTLDSHFWTSRS